jgi:hypothetical protein
MLHDNYYQIVTHEVCDVPTYLNYILAYLHYISFYLLKYKIKISYLLTWVGK